MTPERFRELAQAYGADLRRWPADEQVPAQRLAAHDDAGLRQLLAEAAQLDAVLAAHVVAAPDAALFRRIVASAPAQPAQPVKRRPLRLWWSGAGIAGVGLAGALAGTLAMSAAASALIAPTALTGIDRPYAATAFGGSASDWSDE